MRILVIGAGTLGGYFGGCLVLQRPHRRAVGAGCNARASDVMMLEMWEKWVGLATTAGITCLMRASIGDIVAAPGGRDAILHLLHQNSAVAEASGFKPRSQFIEYCSDLFTTAGSPLKASMLRDIERGSTTEGEHVLGDLATRARALGVETPLLDLARIHVVAYEAGRARQTAGS
jgi:2-dehydropantoate 2-reductase